MSSNSVDYKSYHIFLFPFKWEIGQDRISNASFDNRVNMQTFEEKLEARIGGIWERSRFGFNDFEDYNEFNYFYDFVRESIYDLNPELASVKNNTESLFRHYEYKNLGTNATYRIKVDETCEYVLDIDYILLNVYSTGTGIMSFHLKNNDRIKSSPKDILKINQYGRRLFPPFLAKGIGLEGTRAEIPMEISIHGLDSQSVDSLIENFAYYDKQDTPLNSIEDPLKHISTIQSQTFHLPTFVAGLLPKGVFVPLENIPNGKISLLPVIDDRMFVICWYGNTFLSNYLTEIDKKTNEYNHLQYGLKSDELSKYRYEIDFWYKYVFVDWNFATCQNPQLYHQFLKEHTYNRWLKFNTLYGITRYSLVCLTAEWDVLKSLNADFLPIHVKSIYYKMIELCLLQRAAVLRFSDEATNLAAKRPTTIIENVSKLYRRYILFVNKIYFREVTAQEQGIEMYNMIQKHMNLSSNVKDLDEEIAELHNYASLIEDRQNNQLLNIITILGALFLIPSFITGFYGMNVFNDALMPHHPTFLLTISLMMVVMGLLSYYLIDTFKFKIDQSGNRKWLFPTLLVFFAFLLFAPMTNQQQPNPSVMEQKQDSILYQMKQINKALSDTSKRN